MSDAAGAQEECALVDSMVLVLTPVVDQHSWNGEKEMDSLSQPDAGHIPVEPVVPALNPDILVEPVSEELNPDILREPVVLEELNPDLLVERVSETLNPDLLVEPVSEELNPDLLVEPVVREELNPDRLLEPVTEELNPDILVELVTEEPNPDLLIEPVVPEELIPDLLVEPVSEELNPDLLVEPVVPEELNPDLLLEPEELNPDLLVEPVVPEELHPDLLAEPVVSDLNTVMPNQTADSTSDAFNHPSVTKVILDLQSQVHSLTIRTQEQECLAASHSHVHGRYTDNLEKEIEALRSEVRQRKTHESKMMEHMAAIQRDEKKRRELTALQYQSEFDALHRKNQESITRLRSQERQMRALIDSLSEEKSELVEEVAVLQKKRQEISPSRVAEELAESNARINDLEVEVTSVKSKLRAKQATLQSVMKTSAELEAEVASLQSKLLQTTDGLARASQELKSTKRLQSQSDIAIQRTSTDEDREATIRIETLESQVTQLSSERLLYKERLHASEKTARDRECQVSKLEVEVSVLENTLTTKDISHRNDIGCLEKQVEGLTEDLKKQTSQVPLRSSRRDSDDTESNLRAQISELVERNAIDSSNYSHLQSVVQGYQARATELTSLVESLQKQLQKQRADNALWSLSIDALPLPSSHRSLKKFVRLHPRVDPFLNGAYRKAVHMMEAIEHAWTQAQRDSRGRRLLLIYVLLLHVLVSVQVVLFGAS